MYISDVILILLTGNFSFLRIFYKIISCDNRTVPLSQSILKKEKAGAGNDTCKKSLFYYDIYDPALDIDLFYYGLAGYGCLNILVGISLGDG